MKGLDRLKGKLTQKQFDTLCVWLTNKPLFTILSGGVRSGKTYLLTLMFLIEASRFKGQNMIILGATISSVQRNVISLLEMWLGSNIKLGKSNQFDLFGNTVYVFGGDSADSYKSIRGFTSCLSMINEMTTLHKTAIDEVINRTSVTGALIIADTNPAYPTHYVKLDYIDKSGATNSSGRLQIYTEHFTMLDNTTLSKDYIDRMITLFPEGSTEYERNILGHWIVREEGTVYNSFDENIHLVNSIPEEEVIDKYIGSVDWGFKHTGVVLVLAKTVSGKYYLIEEIAKTEETFEFWRDKVVELNNKYHVTKWYCDSARPEYVAQLSRVVRATNANKNVLEGIEVINSLLKTKKLFMLRSAFIKGLDEIYKYKWKNGASGKDEVIKENDDVMDAMRYACYNDIQECRAFNTYSGMAPINRDKEQEIEKYLNIGVIRR